MMRLVGQWCRGLLLVSVVTGSAVAGGPSYDVDWHKIENRPGCDIPEALITLINNDSDYDYQVKVGALAVNESGAPQLCNNNASCKPCSVTSCGTITPCKITLSGVVDVLASDQAGIAGSMPVYGTNPGQCNVNCHCDNPSCGEMDDFCAEFTVTDLKIVAYRPTGTSTWTTVSVALGHPSSMTNACD